MTSYIGELYTAVYGTLTKNTALTNMLTHGTSAGSLYIYAMQAPDNYDHALRGLFPAVIRCGNTSWITQYADVHPGIQPQPYNGGKHSRSDRGCDKKRHDGNLLEFLYREGFRFLKC